MERDNRKLPLPLTIVLWIVVGWFALLIMTLLSMAIGITLFKIFGPP